MAESDNLLGSVTSSYASARGFISRLTTIFGLLTFKIKRGKPEETIEELGKSWTLDDAQRRFLAELGATKSGAVFIDEKVQDMNRAAFHRSAFVFNAFTQLIFVDLAAPFAVSFPQLKLALVVFNLGLAAYAHLTMQFAFDELVVGPNALPAKRRLWGLAVNPKYNKAVKRKSRPYARNAWRENSLYRPAYFFNAATIFFGAQFILPVERLIFPFGLIFGKITGLLSTSVMVFDIWRGFKAGDDARIAREKEVGVYRDLDI